MQRRHVNWFLERYEGDQSFSKAPHHPQWYNYKQICWRRSLDKTHEIHEKRMHKLFHYEIVGWNAVVNGYRYRKMFKDYFCTTWKIWNLINGGSNRMLSHSEIQWSYLQGYFGLIPILSEFNWQADLTPMTSCYRIQII